MSPTIDGRQLEEDLAQLATFGARDDGGVDRVAFSPADMAARAWLGEQIARAGLSLRVDAAGNTIGRRAGAAAGLAPIAIGSHTDTVPGGGRYDGALGVLAGLACARALAAGRSPLRHPLEVINFVAEEATMPGGTIGSRAMAGLLEDSVIGQPALDGRPLGDHLRAAGIDPAGLAGAARAPGSLAAYLELHIEQGGVLEAAGLPIGLVEGIVGIRRYAVVIEGQANHAGTTPMAGRRDALVAAAELVLAVSAVAVAQGIVGTVGTLRLQPGSPNVIPGRVELELELRGLDEPTLGRAAAELERRALALGSTWRPYSAKPPSPSDPRIVATLARACERLGLTYRRMASGAGHDAMCVAAIAPQAMLFVPSRGGISHAPSEYTAPAQCLDGARVLLEAVLELDRELTA